MTIRRTDRLADRQNYGSQDRASIAALRGKNAYNVIVRPAQLQTHAVHIFLVETPMPAFESVVGPHLLAVAGEVGRRPRAVLRPCRLHLVK